MTESKFQKDMVRWWESHTGFVFNIHGSEWQKSGIPDLLILHRRWKGFLELKVGKGSLAPIQKKRISEIKDHHFDAFVVYPNRIEDEDGVCLADWSWGTLIYVLRSISKYQRL